LARVGLLSLVDNRFIGLGGDIEASNAYFSFIAYNLPFRFY